MEIFIFCAVSEVNVLTYFHRIVLRIIFIKPFLPPFTLLILSQQNGMVYFTKKCILFTFFAKSKVRFPS